MATGSLKLINLRQALKDCFAEQKQTARSTKSPEIATKTQTDLPLVSCGFVDRFLASFFSKRWVADYQYARKLEL